MMASGVGAAGVDDAGARVAALAAEAVVEPDAEAAQLGDPCRRLVGQQLDRAAPAEAAARGERVGCVERGIVVRGRPPRRRRPGRRSCSSCDARPSRARAPTRPASAAARAAERPATPAPTTMTSELSRFCLTIDNLETESTWLTTLRRKPRPTPCSRPSSRCGRGGCRRCSGSGRASRSRPAGRCRAGRWRRTRRSRSRCGGTWRRRSTCGRCRTSSSSRRGATRSATRRVGSSQPRILGLVPSGLDPASRKTPAGTRSASCPSSRTTTRRSCSARENGCAEALVHESRLRARTAELHARRAARSLRRRARASRGGDEPPARAAPAPAARAHRRARHYGAGGGRPAAIYRFSAAALEITDQFAVLRPPTMAASGRAYPDTRAIAERQLPRLARLPLRPRCCGHHPRRRSS